MPKINEIAKNQTGQYIASGSPWKSYPATAIWPDVGPPQKKYAKIASFLIQWLFFIIYNIEKCWTVPVMPQAYKIQPVMSVNRASGICMPFAIFHKRQTSNGWQRKLNRKQPHQVHPHSINRVSKYYVVPVCSWLTLVILTVNAMSSVTMVNWNCCWSACMPEQLF